VTLGLRYCPNKSVPFVGREWKCGCVASSVRMRNHSGGLKVYCTDLFYNVEE
jgi:hypothetical protein